jgi:hypothetical protein
MDVDREVHDEFRERHLVHRVIPGAQRVRRRPTIVNLEQPPNLRAGSVQEGIDLTGQFHSRLTFPGTPRAESRTQTLALGASSLHSAAFGSVVA